MLLLSAQHKVVSKAARTARQQLEAAISRQEQQILSAFKTFLEHARSPQTMREVRALLDENNIGGAIAIIDTHIEALGRVIPKAFVDAANATFSGLSAKLGGGALVAKAKAAKLAVTFDPSDERAASLMRGAQLQFVQNITSAQRETIRSALADAYQDGGSTASAVKAFRGAIGLTQTQQDAVDSYQAALEAGSKDALARELRDRRFDRTVANAAETDEGLDADQIERMVDRYRENMLTYRAENIARTESLAVVGAARQEATRQIIDQTGIDGGDVTRTWRATKDKRTRDSHWEMDGQTVGLDEPFTTPDGDELMYPGDPDAPAKERINCRCTVTIGIE